MQSWTTLGFLLPLVDLVDRFQLALQPREEDAIATLEEIVDDGLTVKVDLGLHHREVVSEAGVEPQVAGGDPEPAASTRARAGA